MRKRVLLLCIVLAGAIVGVTHLALGSVPGIQGGKFEVTCRYNGSNQVDPIVSPGIKPSAHLHDFFGAVGVTENSTPDSIRGGPTSCVLSRDTAGYWVPAAYRSDTGAKLQPVKQFEYYFGEAGVSNTVPIPAGLEMVAGNSHALSPADVIPNSIAFSCGNGGSAGNRSPTLPQPYNCATHSGVVSSQGVTAIVFFPYCWDGVQGPPWNVVYGDPQTGNCPAGYLTMPQLQEHEHFGNGANDPKRFDRGDLLTFASGPWYTYHADYMQGWDLNKMISLSNGCTKIHRDCGFVNDQNPGP